MMKLTDNWGALHELYKKEDWIKLPSIFAQQAVEYFPTRGKILELGAGLGQDSIFFASKGFEVTCTDFNITSAASVIGEETAGAYANKFTTILLDDNGETYKDSAKGIHHLIRYVGHK